MRAIELDPGYADARLGLGVVLLTRQRYEEAVEHLAIVVEVAPLNPQGWTNLGIAFLGLHRYQHALEAFERSLALDPSQDHARAGRERALQGIRQGG